mgnify:CR=1 FL=1
MILRPGYRLLMFSAIFAVALYGCGKDPIVTPEPEPVDTNDNPITNPGVYNRDSAVKDYNEMYLGSVVTSIGWTGNTGNCDAGTVPQSVHDAVIKRINYYRKIVGLNYDCVMDESLYAEQQKTALIMCANGDLSHDPPASWKCYSPEGAKGAKQSNLALGNEATDAIDAFIDDAEEYNKDVGHRRWMLYSKQSAFSHGSANNVEVVHVIVKAENTKIPEFIAYPPANFIPRQVLYHRWSFSIPDADFSNAQVTVKSDGQDMGLEVVSRTTKVADNTIVWDMAAGTIPATISADKIYTVTVSGVGGAPKSSYTYDVKVINP